MAIASPTPLLLGRDTSARLLLPAALTSRPNLVVSVGHIERVEQLADGRWAATYIPPPQRFPQVALVVATSSGGQPLAWGALPLWGQPTIQVNSEAQTRVWARVAGKVQQSATTDAAGRAPLRLLVPPGIREATLVASDAMGNVQESQVALPPAEGSQLLALCPKTVGDRIWLFAVTAEGHADSDAQFPLEAEGARWAEVVLRSPGVFTARLAVDSLPATRQLSMRVGKRGSSGRVTCDLSMEAEEEPNGLSLMLDRNEYAAGRKASSVHVRIDVHYPGSRRPRSVVPTLEPSFGQVGPLRSVAPTRFEVEWILPNALAGRRMAKLRARIAGVPGAVAVSALRLVAGPPARVELAEHSVAVVSSGQESVSLRARALDAFDNVVMAPHFQSQANGHTTNFASDDNGWHVARYTPSPLRRRGEDQVVVRAGDALARVEVQLLAPGALFELSVGVGVSSNFGLLVSPLAAVRLRANLPWFGGGVFARVRTGWSASSSEQLRADGAEELTVSLSAVPALMALGYALQWRAVEVHAGVEGGGVMSVVEVASDRSGRDERLVASPAIGVFAGSAVPLGFGRVFAEAAYIYAPLVGAVTGNALGFQLGLGYGVEL